MTNKTFLVVSALILVIGWFYYTDNISVSQNQIDYVTELKSCDVFELQDQKLDCWYGVIKKVHNQEGTGRAFVVFDYLYENEPMFVETGCHLHSHRVGDFTYYDNYVKTRDLDSIEFPDGSQVCGYGFYHGFFEHLIQDEPNAEYVDNLCNYFDERLSDIMPAIRITCYHGSGHGFALAEVDEGDLSNWGNYNGIIAEPLRLCEELQADEGEKEECRQGVFNVLVLWMEIGEYGLTYDWDYPFTLCETQEEINKQACYYEMGQKMDTVSNFDIEKAMEVLNRVPDKQFIPMLLENSIGGFLQTTLVNNAEFDYMEKCVTFEGELERECIKGIVSGLFEHGDPGDEYKKVIAVCTQDYLEESHKNICFTELETRFAKFYSNAEREVVCDDQPNREDLGVFCAI